jgi:hypothetical protein
MIKVVAILGRLNSGKGTFAKVFSDSGKFTPMAFADPIKIILQDLFHLSTEELWGTSDKRTPRGRELMQVFGTDFARKYEPEIWVNKMYERIGYYTRHGVDTCFPLGYKVQSKDGIVITDLRFSNEAKMLREEYDATLIKIVRPHGQDDATVEQNQHASETAVDYIPHEWIRYGVFNTGTREDLLGEAARLLEIICSQ